MFDGAWIHFTGETAEWLSTRTAGSNKTGEVALTYRNGGSFQTILCINAVPGLHHPDMHFDTDALENGVKILKIATKKLLG